MIFGKGQNPSQASLTHLQLFPYSFEGNLGFPEFNGCPPVCISEGLLTYLHAASLVEITRKSSVPYIGAK
jgi:hypothetical protein